MQAALGRALRGISGGRSIVTLPDDSIERRIINARRQERPARAPKPAVIEFALHFAQNFRSGR